MNARAGGIALVMALVVMLLVDVLTAGMLALTTRERLVTASQSRALRAQAASEFAVQTAFAQLSTFRLDTLAPGSRIALPIAAAMDADISQSVTAMRLWSGAILIRAEARVGAERAYASRRIVALARMLDRNAVLRHNNSAFMSGGPAVLAGSTRVQASPDLVPPGWDESFCPRTDPLPVPAAARTARAALVGESVYIDPSAVIDSALALPDSLAAGGVKWSEVASITDRTESGIIWPTPVEMNGVCMTNAPGNWGDPLHPSEACGAYFPMIHVRGNIVVKGGMGQGILLVDGTLTLQGGAVFVGIIVARAGITLEPGSRIDGALESQSGYLLSDDAAIFYSRCAIARVLDNSLSARRPVLQQQRYIRTF